MNITIVGAGIAGLSAAFELQQSGFEVMLLEGSERLGGKILTSEIEGFNIDAGPDSFLTRDPEMRELCFSLGVGDELVPPTGKPAKVWVDGEMHNLPKRHFLGVPLDLDELDELSLLTKEGAKRAKLDLTLPDNKPREGETVGSLIRRRLGDEVMDRLVGPLLGGINAGDADDLCLESGVPQLFDASQRDFSLVRSVQNFLKDQNRDPASPVFLTHPDGLQTVVKRLEEQIDSNIRRNERVTSVEISDNSILVKGSQEYQTDAVILCIPAFVAAKLLQDSCPDTSNLLAKIQYASMAFITFAFNKGDVPQFNGSGFLI
ncbi:MAG: protoporphyrinogen oxidase, partial [Actinomycetota bacterium]|nr:protoporphyrinogen oxidase [Actinomycetota bacterium]